ncbi:mitochondrial inner membrane protease ATP23-like [Salvia hispanica]|uniref:mitochondrial inner membrane protease ATP23-like n=1 Tax=Salvia hispanica TaxID=49212 RepID=UPI0020093179|nr:mitochondrial inner membrane protease ATP23-like [Salvia hispanica]
MNAGRCFGSWVNSSGSGNGRYKWQVKESTSTVTTRSGLRTGDPFPFDSESEEEWNSSEEETVGDMANVADPDPEIGSLTAHLDGEPIQVCSNNLRCEDEVVQVVIHELVRAYDECRAANLDWTNCTHHACNEIRANHLSGYCHLKRELLRGHFNIKGHEQECVWRRAIKAVIGNPYCSEIEAEDAMKSVWSSCYNDTAPFDRAP